MTSSSSAARQLEPNAHSPARMLEGMSLRDGWTVERLIRPGPEATGGHFSTSYLVRDRAGSQAFMKAIDFVAALNSSDPARTLADLTNAYNFERDLVKSCNAKRMSRVVRAIHDGSVTVPNAGPIPQVSYLIFELADGDIRTFRATSGHIDMAWALRSLYHASMGVGQLHAEGIAHQDLKPSNVMTFGPELCKLADLGRASLRAGGSPFDDLAFAGDVSYAPPEVFYGFLLPNWAERRQAADLFALGSLLLFQLTAVNATGAMFSKLHPAHLPAASGGGWTGAYDDVVLYLRDALGQVALDVPELPDSKLREDILARFRELCEPDPRLRGHPKDHHAQHRDSYSVERYVSYFHAMAARAERLVLDAVGP
jgi:serine/threonine protein kinase